jgi:autotransporter-associated beta strand protein
MNPDKPTRDEIEVKLTALLLGELPDDEARLLRWAVSQDAGLAKLHDQLKRAIGLVREVSVKPVTTDAALKLSDERRKQLLAHFKTPRPAPKELFWLKRLKLPALVPALVAVAIISVVAAMLLPAMSAAKRKVQNVAGLSMASARMKSAPAAAVDENVPASIPASPAPVALAPPPPAEIVLPKTEGSSSWNLGVAAISLQNGEPQQVAPALQNMFVSSSSSRSSSSSSQNSALQQRAQSTTTSMGAVAAKSGIGSAETGGGGGGFAIAGKSGLGAESEQANTISTDTILGWNDSGPDRSRAENQPNGGDAWQPPAKSFELAGDGAVFNGAVAASQNRAVEGEKLYRNTAGETGADKTPFLGDTPTAGRMFASSTMAPAATPVLSGTPAPADGFFLADSTAPKNLGEEFRKLSNASSGTRVLNGVNAYTGESVVNSGALSFDTPVAASGNVSGAMNLGLISPSPNGALPSREKAKASPDGMFQFYITNAVAMNGDAENPTQSRRRVARATPVFNTTADTQGLPGSSAIIYTNVNMTFVGGIAYTASVQVAPVPPAVAAATKELTGEDRSIQKTPMTAPIPQPEILTRENAFSTFSLNVSDVSFKLAEASLQNGRMPDASSIRSEEFINAFDYRDPEAVAGRPVAFASERARDPFAQNRDLLRFSIKAAAAGRAANRPLNLVLLLDTSGSMERADRVAIIREAMRVLAMQLHPQDTVSVVTFARTARLWADGVAGDKAGETLSQVGGITLEGGTNLEEAMRLAYETARRHYLANGVNRVVLLTDGAANLGNVDAAALKQKVEAQRKQGIALDCFGIGWEDFNDDMLAELSGNGDGRYAFINSPEEAGTEFAAKLAGALQVAAQDVKVQVEFNPQRVISWRQIGYAKHQLTKEQFRDNSVIAAEIAAQEAGNALYTVETKPDGTGPVATVYVRYKVPGTMEIQEHSWDVPYNGNAPALGQSSAAMRLAATAGAFSEWLAASPFAQEVSPDELLKDLSGVPQIYGADQRPKQLEWMIRQAKSLADRPGPPGRSGGF